jgi:hypothetical protein
MDVHHISFTKTSRSAPMRTVNVSDGKKSGNPISITLDGNLQGCKEVFVLYAYETDGNNPQITDWRLHQYHIESTEKDEGELVVSKIFYELEKNQFKWAEKSHAQSAQVYYLSLYFSCSLIWYEITLSPLTLFFCFKNNSESKLTDHCKKTLQGKYLSYICWISISNLLY